MIVAKTNQISSASEWLSALIGWARLLAWVIRGGLKAD